ncbi:putative ATP/GTP-binding protein [hydrothermal vent metagenome]|uniref:Putative ATP/GTP-binding protein n=1 Tax=hydrothermal vent metagenome TaxID=652676 RepID=A0A3B0YQV2_9ZZZZ
MSNHKIIFTGPVGAGKTTAIASVSDVPLLSTEKSATDMTKNMKPNTTVALDYGSINLGGKERIHLYGTPGQERFDFMWDILTKGGIGLLLLLNNSRPDPFHDMRFFSTRLTVLSRVAKSLSVSPVLTNVTGPQSAAIMRR